jgi:hypothetical protein
MLLFSYVLLSKRLRSQHLGRVHGNDYMLVTVSVCCSMSKNVIQMVLERMVLVESISVSVSFLFIHCFFFCEGDVYLLLSRLFCCNVPDQCGKIGNMKRFRPSQTLHKFRCSGLHFTFACLFSAIRNNLVRPCCYTIHPLEAVIQRSRTHGIDLVMVNGQVISRGASLPG